MHKTVLVFISFLHSELLERMSLHVHVFKLILVLQKFRIETEVVMVSKASISVHVEN